MLCFRPVIIRKDYKSSILTWGKSSDICPFSEKVSIHYSWDRGDLWCCLMRVHAFFFVVNDVNFLCCSWLELCFDFEQ